MKKCEICQTDREYRQHIFKESNPLTVMNDSLILKSDVYMCDCPQIIPDELHFIQETKIQLSNDNVLQMVSLKKQKKEWIDSHIKDMVLKDDKYDNWKISWKNAIKEKIERGLKLIDNPCYDEVVATIHKHLWSLLYQLEKETK